MTVRRPAKAVSADPLRQPVIAGPPAAPGRPGPARPASQAVARIKYWHWLAACGLLLLLLAFVTRPGNIIADTKIDLAVNPAGFLGRALHLWDPAQFGQLQNQAAGYFFPMGPFFVLGKLAALPGWVAQRLWLTVISVAAFLGVVRLSERLDLGTPGTRIAAGMAYALAPRALTLLGVNSGELLPAAMLPLVLIPLVRLLRHGRELDRLGRLRAAAQSAAAVALCSGMNAASVAAVLIMAAIYVLTGQRSWSRWRVLGYWLPAVAAATCWWSVPLLLLGKYGVSILPYTESAQVTTSVTSLSNTLRGTEDWDAYLVINGSPWWPVGYQLVTGTLPALLTGLVAGLGLGGLLTRRTPERRFLLCALLAGLVLVGAGYVSGLGNPLAAAVDHLINGSLAPLRNLRKFDPLIRLPVSLGLAQLLATVRAPRPRVAVQAVAAAALALVALPAFTTGVSQAGDFPAFPSYWTSAADWLNAHAGHQAVLEVPGARFGEYTWGRPLDDALEPLFTGDWASDQLEAIGSAGNARLLAAIEQRLDAGAGSAGLTQLLAGMGIEYLVVRNDLDPGDLYGAWPARIHDALTTSPGLTEVAHFGKHKVGNKARDDAISNFYAPYPPVEIYRVDGSQPVASVVPQAGAIRVVGAPESALALADAGLLDGRPVLLNSDGRGIAVSQDIVTDTLRRRLRNFGEIRIDYTQTLTRADPLATFEAASDYLEPSWLPDESVAQYHGIANVTASSSAAGIAALPGQSATGSSPFAAVDGDPRTLWESGALTGPVHQWLQVDFDQRIDPRVIRVAFADSIFRSPPVTRVTVQTSAGGVTDDVRPTSEPQQLAVPPGATGWLRITVAAVVARQVPSGAQVGITDIAIPGVTASRTIMAPAVRLAGGLPQSVLLAKAQPQPSGCMLTSLRWVCSPFLATPADEQYGFDEGFVSASDRAAAVRGRAVMISTAQIARAVWSGRNQPRVTASSQYTSDPQDMASAAFDGTKSTAWVAAASDHHPVLTIRWHGIRTVRAITVGVPPGGSSPAQVQVTDPAGVVGGGFTGRKGGELLLPRPVRTNQLSLTFSPSSLPLQISEVGIPGVRPLRANLGAPVRLRCGLGPTVSVNGRPVPTSASGTYADLLYGRPMTFTGCAGVTVRAGQNVVTEPAVDPTGWDVQSVLVGPAAGRPALARSARVEPARPVTWTAASRVLRVAASQPAYLEVAQNFNAGWQAVIGGRVLRPVRLDGWEQAWLLPAGTRGLVTLTYRPDALYRKALFGGFGLLVLIIGVAIGPRRRRARAASAGTAGAPAAAVAGSQYAGSARGQRRFAGTSARWAGLVVLALAGLWLGGYPGAALLPAATAGFIVAGRHARPDSWSAGPVTCSILTSRWLVVALLMAAAAGGAARGLVADTGTLATAVTDIGPQILSLLVVARLAAEEWAGVASPVMAMCPDTSD